MFRRSGRWSVGLARLKGGPMKRTIALILISICLTGAAACSSAGASGSHGGSQASGTGQGMTVLRQLAHCIRSHGEPGFPDPIINPLTGAPDFPQDAPDVPASVQQACQSIANRLPPDVQQSQPPTARNMQALLRFAHCMRSHGIPAWPEPLLLIGHEMSVNHINQPYVLDHRSKQAQVIETLNAHLFHVTILPCSCLIPSSMQRRINGFFSLSTCSMSEHHIE